jgi:uncharacterized membrane protein
MRFSPILLVHICTGIIAVLFGSVALLVRKGGHRHRLTGDVFAIAMLMMSASGAYMSFWAWQQVNILAGLFTFYLVSTGWLTVIRKPKATGRAEVGLMLLGLAIVIIALTFALNASHGKGEAPPYVIFGSVALLSTSGDVRMLIRGGVAGGQRLVRHLWRMCFALFIATASFFIGTSGDPVMRRSGLRATLFPESLRQTHLNAVPVLMVVLLTVFWVCRVRFSNAYKKELISK